MKYTNENNSQLTQRDSLVRSAGRGAAWQIAGGGWQAVVRMAGSVVLARLLSPMDFGILSMAIIGRELIRQIGNLGMGAGIIAKKELSQEDLNTCFWCMTVIAFLLVVLAFWAAPLIGVFFQTPDLVSVLRVVSLTLIFDFVRIVPVKILHKQLRFRPIILIKSVNVLLEIPVIIFLIIYAGYSYWALVYGMLFSSIFLTIMIFGAAKWLPGTSMSWGSLKYFMNFGLNLQGFSIINFLQHHLDYILIGRILGTASLGYYQFATKIPDLFKQRLATPLAAVIYPTVSRFQDDNDQLLSGYGKTMRYMALGIFPAMGGLAVIAHELVTVLWGQKWLPVVVPFQIFCFCGAIRCIMTPTGAIFNTKHRPDLLLKFSLLQLTVTFVAVVGFGYMYGLNGVAFGMLTAQVFSLLALKWMANLVESSMIKVLAFLRQPFIATVVMMTILAVAKWIMLMSGLGSFAVLVLCMGLGLVVYVLALKIMFRDICEDVLLTISEIVGKANLHKLKWFCRIYT